MPNIGPVELIIILVIALIVIGPGRLPDVGAALGKSIREFRKASSDITDAARVDTSPVPPAQTPSATAPQPAPPAAAEPPVNQPSAAPAPTPEPPSASPTSTVIPAPVLAPPTADDEPGAPPA